MAGENVVHVSEQNWQSEVMESPIPVLTDFWAPWCGPCKAIAPILDQLADELDGSIKITKVNVDDSPQLAGRFGIRSIPTLLVFKDGQVQEQMVGSMSKDALKARLEQHLE